MLLTQIKDINNFSTLSADTTWSFKDITRSETNYISHGYHRYPAKFIPQLVNRLIQEHTNVGDIVLDPFGGCGTTLVEAKVLGRNSIGFDINPVAKLITDTKTTPIKPLVLKTTLEKLLRELEFAEYNNQVMHSERTNYWFDQEIVSDLDRLYEAIQRIKSHKVRRFYICAFSHILKNCSRWLMKSIKPQVDPSKKYPEVFSTYISHIHQMMSKNDDYYRMLESCGNLKVHSKMKLQDSTRKFPLDNNSIDLIVTSPPYVTSYEYADLHQLILLWLGDDSTRYPRWSKYAHEYQTFRKKFVGTKIGNENNQIEDFLGKNANQIISQLPEVRKYAKSVTKYFSSMNKSFSEMFRVLKSGGRACIIIGNTALAGVDIRNAEVTVEQMRNAGFKVEEVIKRELSNKMITPWRDKENGRFTGTDSINKRRVYQYEYIIIALKPQRV